MVATKISEVAGKGLGWATTTAPAPSRIPIPSPASPSAKTSSDSYWDYANESLAQTAERTYSTISSYLPTFTTHDEPHLNPIVMENLPLQATPPTKTNLNRRKPFSSPLALFKNPHISVRGGGNYQPHRHSSMQAVRSLLNVVPVVDMDDDVSQASSEQGDSIVSDSYPSWTRDVSSRMAQTPSTSSSSETASQLAEGTVRAFRDLCLDEAVELHKALRYWSYRWERPLLSWLEAGPTIWFSKTGYQHRIVGQKVSQIQAVLARRCIAIGELQQHLLRAGWQQGVAQWGVLGEGGDWAAVSGFDGTMATEDTRHTPLKRVSSELSDMPLPLKQPKRDNLPHHPASSVSKLPQMSRRNSLYYANVVVRNMHDGRIVTDDPALAEWSVDAMGIIRRQLYRAANGMAILPYSENWAEGDDAIEGKASFLIESSSDEPFPNEKDTPNRKFPLWASLSPRMPPVDESSQTEQQQIEQRMTISDLPLMVAEVADLLSVLEDVINLQRARRLEKLKPPRWLRRNWYMSAVAAPAVTYLCFKMRANADGWDVVKNVTQTIITFFREHVTEPLSAIIADLLKGTENISDREARKVTIDNLKIMIHSWLDDNYPSMPAEERAMRAQAMDISLIEAKKSESLKSIYEINNVIRMSFIEAQFIKKEMMSAMLALDEMQASNNINMNLAAVTPAVLLVYSAKKAFQFLFYTLIKLGKSTEETYGSFLHVLIEIERLLVMRDAPPAPPIMSVEDSLRRQQLQETNHPCLAASDDNVLNADDLGMLMLHIHELRTILWQDRKRFFPDIIRSVAEDLGEIAGERGAVSVRQQLQIINRMCRTYPFLKLSSRIFFEYVKD